MNLEIFNPKNIIVQGITGKFGAFHTKRMLDSGTNIIAGVTPGKSGQKIHNIPVFDKISDIQEKITIDASVIFVPATFAKSAIIEAISAEIPLIIAITEGIPIRDMLEINFLLKNSSSVLIGPNCPGILIPGLVNLGIIPDNLTIKGSTAVVSRSGTLTYEAVSLLSERGIGQKYIIGIGGDMISGSSFIDILKYFQADDEVENIILIGEIGGTNEIEAAKFIKDHISKPVFGYIAGWNAPPGVKMGHAGAILGSNKLESAQAKTDIFNKYGITTATSLPELITKM